MTRDASNGSITIGIRSLLIGLGLVIAIVTGTGTVVYQAQTSLSREQAYREFVTQSQYALDKADLSARFDRIDSKLDTIINNWRGSQKGDR